MRRKLGLSTQEPGDRQLVEDLLGAMQRNQADFTLTFRALCQAAQDPQGARVPGLDDWTLRWRARMAQEATTAMSCAESMRLVNPAYIPRNHRIEQVIVAAVEHADFAPFEELSQVLSQPYLERAALAAYGDPPRPSERVLQTFCGT
jgi:uncharacterized protein YdiU (UPF0061 family)